MEKQEFAKEAVILAKELETYYRPLGELIQSLNIGQGDVNFQSLESLHKLTKGLVKFKIDLRDTRKILKARAKTRVGGL